MSDQDSKRMPSGISDNHEADSNSVTDASGTCSITCSMTESGDRFKEEDESIRRISDRIIAMSLKTDSYNFESTQKGPESLFKKEHTETKVASPSTPSTSIPKPTVADPVTPKPIISNPSAPRSTIPNPTTTDPNSVLKSDASTDTPKLTPKLSSGNNECIDLTDDAVPPVKTTSTSNSLPTAVTPALSSSEALLKAMLKVQIAAEKYFDRK